MQHSLVFDRRIRFEKHLLTLDESNLFSSFSQRSSWSRFDALHEKDEINAESDGTCEPVSGTAKGPSQIWAKNERRTRKDESKLVGDTQMIAPLHQLLRKLHDRNFSLIILVFYCIFASINSVNK